MPRNTEPGNILRISNKKLKLLLELCKQNECLWNSKLEGYPKKYKYQRRRALADIADQLQIEGFTAEHVFRKFTSIRRGYCWELTKIARSEARVARGEAQEVHKPSTVWFSIMDSFMRPHVHLESTGLEEQPKIKRVIKKKSQTVVTPMESEVQKSIDFTFKKKPERITIDLSDKEANCFQPICCQPIGKEERSDQELEEFTVEQDFKKEPGEPEVQDDHVQSTGTDYLLENEGGFHQCFGNYVASLLSKMPPQKAMELQPKILRLIFSNLEES